MVFVNWWLWEKHRMSVVKGNIVNSVGAGDSMIA